MNIKEIMEIDVKNLKQKQLDALKEHTLEILLNIVKLIKNNEFDEVKNYLEFSPAGDGHGCDNYFINFKYADEDLDLDEILDKMKYLMEYDK